MAAQMGEELEAVHLRHPQVGDHEVDRLGLEGGDGLAAVGGGDHLDPAAAVRQGSERAKSTAGSSSTRRILFMRLAVCPESAGPSTRRHTGLEPETGTIDPGLNTVLPETHENAMRKISTIRTARSRLPAHPEPAPHAVPPPVSLGAGAGTSCDPGDTLRAITARFSAPRALAAGRPLNPGIADPDRLGPGQRIRVPAGASRAPRPGSAAVAQGRGAALADPLEDARVGDMLVERDAVRTYPRSSAEMAFPDGARLR